ncbi:hypothetical protein LTR66_014906, partial [Elasticomyces elasticus]
MENPTAQGIAALLIQRNMPNFSDQPKSSTKRKRKNKKKAGKPANTTESTDAVQQAHIQENGDHDEDHESNVSEPEIEDSDAPKPNGTSPETSVDEDAIANLTNGTRTMSVSDELAAATARFDAMVRDRDVLREEVTRLRQSLEETVAKHDNDMGELQTQLQDTQTERETAEENYQNLLGKVNTIRSQLGERLKADAEDLAQARTNIEDLEEQKSNLQEQYTARETEISDLNTKNLQQSKELDGLRKRGTLSQSNWTQERDNLVEQEKYLREEFEEAKQAMHDWEALAMEERSIRRDLSDRVSDLEDQLASTRSEYDRAISDRDAQSSTVDSLQKAMQEIQTARRNELRELVESSQQEMNGIKKQLEDTKSTLKQQQNDLDSTQKELERALPFEKEVKEKNLLIGKLRHEAVILSDHLTKALRFLRKGKTEDNVDRQVVTNHFLHFLTLDRSDPKKFQILQLIS